MRRTALIWTSIGVAALVALAGCSEADPEATTSTTTAITCDSSALLSCAQQSTLAPYAPSEPTQAQGEPIRIGMINQENTPGGSFPELSLAVQAGIRFINDEMGGVDGRPLALEVCNTEFSAEGSTSCAQEFVEKKVPAVLGGIDVFGNGIDTLAQNGIPFVGGIPISSQSFTAPNSFQWSGGSQSAGVAFAWYAGQELSAERVSIVYQDFGSIADSAEVAKQVLGGYGTEVQMVPYPVLATDLSSALTAAASTSPEAMIIFAADSGCKAGFDGVASLGLTAATFYVGACAAPSIIDQVSAEATNGVYFNVDGPLVDDPPLPDGQLYEGVIAEYGGGLDPAGAGTVSFRSLMNLYVILSQLDGDITPASITSALQATVDAPNFGGHPYTCDGEQFDGLPALCSPQQILAQMQERNLNQVTDWIDVGQIYNG